jgi:hypothetical protein
MLLFFVYLPHSLKCIVTFFSSYDGFGFSLSVKETWAISMILPLNALRSTTYKCGLMYFNEIIHITQKKYIWEDPNSLSDCELVLFEWDNL